MKTKERIAAFYFKKRKAIARKDRREVVEFFTECARIEPTFFSDGKADKPVDQRKLWRLVREGGVDMVAVYSIADLLPGGLLRIPEILKLTRFLTKHDTIFASLKEGFDTLSPIGRFRFLRFCFSLENKARKKSHVVPPLKNRMGPVPGKPFIPPGWNLN